MSFGKYIQVDPFLYNMESQKDEISEVEKQILPLVNDLNECR